MLRARFGCRWNKFLPAFVFIFAISNLAFAAGDCFVKSITFSTTTARAGEDITASFTVRNAGSTDAVCLHGEASFPGYNFYQGEVFNLAAGEERVIGPHVFHIPSEFTKGMYPYWACIATDSGYIRNCIEQPLMVDSPNIVDITLASLSSKLRSPAIGGQAIWKFVRIR